MLYSAHVLIIESAGAQAVFILSLHRYTLFTQSLVVRADVVRARYVKDNESFGYIKVRNLLNV